MARNQATMTQEKDPEKDLASKCTRWLEASMEVFSLSRVTQLALVLFSIARTEDLARAAPATTMMMAPRAPEKAGRAKEARRVIRQSLFRPIAMHSHPNPPVNNSMFL